MSKSSSIANYAINGAVMVADEIFSVFRYSLSLSLLLSPCARGLASPFLFRNDAVTNADGREGGRQKVSPLSISRCAFAFAEHAEMLPARRKFAIRKPLGLSSIRNDTSSALGLPRSPSIPALASSSLCPFLPRHRRCSPFVLLLMSRPSNSGGDLLGKFPRRRDAVMFAK